jgi:hypothetical protein
MAVRINTSSIDKKEREITRKSKKWLKNSTQAKEYLKLYKLSNKFNYSLVHDFSYKETEDELTIKYLGSRIFNFGIISYKALISGYYQVSFSLMREFVETQFLLDYFRTNKHEIGKWRTANNSERQKYFKPSILYKNLDSRDHFFSGERKKQYQLFCEYAAHPTYSGFHLLANSNNLIETGCLYDEKKLLNGMYDLAKRYCAVTLALSPLLRIGNPIAIKNHIKLLNQYNKVLGTDKSKKSSKTLIRALREYLRNFN